MAWNRRKHKVREFWFTVIVLITVACGSWWVFLRSGSRSQVNPSLELGARTATTVGDRETQPTPEPNDNADVAVKSTPTETQPVGSSNDNKSSTAQPEAPPPSKPTLGDLNTVIVSAQQALDAGELLKARDLFNQAWRTGVPSAQRSSVREKLEKLATETILTPRMVPGDPLVERYTVQTGDLLEKIASFNKVSIELLSKVNALSNPNMIRIGQTLKIVKGPFRAVVDKSTYTMDVFAGDTFIRQFRVGLGADDSTPTGEWRVSTKLRNPTYYPPRGGQIITADDPKNPLGEFWIGLEGMAGEAIGQERYGIHGTIEPETIGKNASMGCIRLRNEDVELLFSYLVERHSTVSVHSGSAKSSMGASESGSP